MIAARYDVAILGGGPAGLAAAAAIGRRSPASVLVADAAEPGQEQLGESAPPGLLACVERLGLGAQFRRAGHLPCPGHVSLWGGARPGFNDFIFDPKGPAWRLDRSAFDAMLAEAAAARGATLSWRTRFLAARPIDGGGYTLRLGQGGLEHTVEARWVVDATGPGASFARSRGAALRVDDRLFAVARFARTGDGPGTLQAMIEAVAGGWWYAARLPRRRLITMHVTDLAGLRRMRSDAGAWPRALAATELIAPSLAPLGVEPEGSPIVRPIHSARLVARAGADWIAIGDAAASFDPLSARGLHKALTDALAAAERISAAVEPGRDLLDADPSDAAAARFRAYSEERAHLYGLEQRWPDAPFWRGRRLATARALS